MTNPPLFCTHRERHGSSTAPFARSLPLTLALTPSPSEGGWSHIIRVAHTTTDHCLRTWTTPAPWQAGVYEARGWFLTLPPWPPNPPDHPLFISSQNQA